VAIGNKKLMAQIGAMISTELDQQVIAEQALGKTVSFIAVENEVTGYVTITDAIKETSKQAISALQRQGIDVVMLTGDNQLTAKSVADTLGLGSFQAECLPEDKLNFIKNLQESGKIVAMAGDGINDAPALKKADIGIAMGIRGTQVAKEAADMILRNDAFATIVHAIAEGRVIYTNVRRFTVYLLSCNLSEILVVAIAVLAGLPLPLLPLQILFLNLVTDVFPAFALGTVKADQDVLKRPPRSSDEKILGKRQYLCIFAHSLSITTATLLALGYALYILQLPDIAATTVSFYTLALAQIWHVFNMRNWREQWRVSAVTRSGYIWAAVALCLLLLCLASVVPVMSNILKLQSLEASTWLSIFTCSLLPVATREIAATIRRLRRSHPRLL